MLHPSFQSVVSNWPDRTGRERSRTLPGLTLCTNDQINFAEIII